MRAASSLSLALFALAGCGPSPRAVDDALAAGRIDQAERASVALTAPRSRFGDLDANARIAQTVVRAAAPRVRLRALTADEAAERLGRATPRLAGTTRLVELQVELETAPARPLRVTLLGLRGARAWRVARACAAPGCAVWLAGRPGETPACVRVARPGGGAADGALRWLVHVGTGGLASPPNARGGALRQTGLDCRGATLTADERAAVEPAATRLTALLGEGDWPIRDAAGAWTTWAVIEPDETLDAAPVARLRYEVGLRIGGPGPWWVPLERDAPLPGALPGALEGGPVTVTPPTLARP